MSDVKVEIETEAITEEVSLLADTATGPDWGSSPIPSDGHAECMVDGLDFDGRNGVDRATTLSNIWRMGYAQAVHDRRAIVEAPVALEALEGFMSVSHLVELLQAYQRRCLELREERDDLHRELEATRDRVNRLQEDKRRLQESK